MAERSEETPEVEETFASPEATPAAGAQGADPDVEERAEDEDPELASDDTGSAPEDAGT